LGNYNPTTDTSTGGKIYLCVQASACDEAGDWEQVIGDGFGNPQNYHVESLLAFNGRLYAVTGNGQTGLEVWRTTNGVTWEQVGFAGFGDSNNIWIYSDNSTTVFKNSLFIGMFNGANGGEVWQMLNQIYLPLILR
jgi:hypothetical protein